MGAATLLEKAILWDNHACMPLRPGDTRFLDRLEMHRAAGFSAVTLNVGMDMIPMPDVIRLLATMRGWVQQHSDHYVLGTSVAAITAAKRSGRLAVLFDLEGGAAVENQPDLIDVYYALGVRWMLIAYNRTNPLGSGCMVDDDSGLTAFGRDVIDAMARVGMILCCSHTGERTARQAIEHNPLPSIFSHSNPAAVHGHRRNISDDLIRACAAKDGVIGLTGFGPFVGADGDVTVERLADMADHVAALVGSQHIGLGLDYVFDPGEGPELAARYPEWFGGFADAGAFPDMLPPAAVPQLAELLLRRGWREADVTGVLGGNLLRVAAAVWK